jgi:asparagine synthase (glutamine-hydrolysing)
MRRLSIIDLQTGKQPISNETGDVWVVYNGEIYNFKQVRSVLEQRGHRFRTQTDTEIIIHAYEEYGDQCVKHFNGMFAIALWDVRKRRLLLIRDRLGVKPLFYWVGPDQLVFGSELKALVVHPEVPQEIDPVSLDLFLTLEYIPGPRTIYKNIVKLMPGHILVLENGTVQVSQYWDVPLSPVRRTEAECVEELRELIREAVRIRLVSDVPLGAFLSGGLDSSTVVGYMCQVSSDPVRAFSIGFQDDTYNELPYAQAVARHFGIRHHFEILNPDITSLVEPLVWHLDEPFADTSIFPTYWVSKLASKDVKVVLSGDGGDEVFAGYDTYLAQRLDHTYARFPAFLRKNVFPAISGIFPPQPTKKGLVNKVKRMVEGGALNPDLRHTRWMVFLSPQEKQVLFESKLKETASDDATASLINRYFNQASGFDALAQQQYVDIKTYLADDILTKVDRMSMAVSLEARVPLLDYHIVEFALNLPPSMRLNGMRTKAILRQGVKNFLPDVVLDKPKQGFSIPMKQWLCNSLKPMMLDLLSMDSLRKHGYFNPKVISAWVQQHLAGRINHSHRLWALMVFQIWHAKK